MSVTTGIIVFCIVVLVGVVYMVNIVLKTNEENKERQRVIDSQNYKLEQQKRMWSQKAAELGVNLNTSVVRCHYANSDKTYEAYHVWVDDAGALCFFPTAPTSETQHFDCYQYPERLWISRIFVKRCYRTGAEGVSYVRDTSDADAKMRLAKFYEGHLRGVLYAKEALESAKNAPTQTIHYDNRRTIIESENGDVNEFSINAFYVFQRIIPDKCR